MDIDAAIDSRIEAMAGYPPDDEVYIDMVVAGGTSPSLSCSTSRDRLERPVHWVARFISTNPRQPPELLLALNDLGDRVALYSFRSPDELWYMSRR